MENVSRNDDNCLLPLPRYQCSWPGKLLLPSTDLENGRGDLMVDSLTVSCQINGTYDINIEEWTCTRPCPPPTLLDPEMMEHDWPDTAVKPEINQEVRHRCLNERHLVSKQAFESGEETTFLDEIMSSCQVTGWMNETIGSYTCTTGCHLPQNHSQVFTHDWDESKGTDIGMVVK